jgi:hypothetical protein
MMADERKGIMSHPIFLSLDILDSGPPLFHTQMGFGNATMDWIVAWSNSLVLKVGADEKLVRLAHFKATEDLKTNTSACNETMEEFAAVQKQLKIDLKIYKNHGKETLDKRKKMKDKMSRQSKDMEIEQHLLIVHYLLARQPAIIQTRP